ncbi:MAG TPA: hypothetical protein VG204_09725 [Terriglobia bacterium]|nr:hypothetical protein [Terriglobia bacterium]
MTHLQYSTTRSGRAWRSREALVCGLGTALLASLPLLVTGVAGTAAAPQAQQADTQSLFSTADAVFKEMSEITGLPIKRPLKKQIVNRAQIKQYLIENLKQEYTPSELEEQQAMLKAFGLVSSDFDLEKFTVNFYTEQAAGVYDPLRKTMLIADWVPAAMQHMVLAHELTHALQDQSFDLEQFVHGARDDDDATSARQAVVEGYATASMLQEMVKPASLATLPSLAPLMNMAIQQPMTQFPAYSSAPFFFRYTALFPYSEGIGFMQAGLAHGGWKRLNELFVKPPTETKEIFEPELYFGGGSPSTGGPLVIEPGASGSPTAGGPVIIEPGKSESVASQPVPAKMTLPSPPTAATGAGLRRVSSNIMGQLGYYCVLGQLISEEEAKKMAPGWLADRYLIFENGATHRLLLVARTRWSSPETALAFFRDYHTVLEKKLPGLTPDSRSSGDLFIGSTSAGQVILIRQGDECRWAEGVPAAETQAMLAWLRGLD